MKSYHWPLFTLVLFLLACQLSNLNHRVTPTPLTLLPASPTDKPPSLQLTPSLAIAPSSTPISPTPTFPTSLSSLRIVFTEEKNIWLWQNSVITSLTTLEDNIQVKISDDGKMIVFERNGLWVINSDGTNERLIVSTDDFKALEPKDPGVGLANFDWIPNTHKLLFNTVLLLDYGLSFTDDLFIADADTSRWSRLRAAGEGGKFLPSPNGEYVALVTSTEIRTMGIDGKAYKTLLNYPWVMNYSETSYYARPFWSTDSQSLIVAIPPQDPLNAASTDQTTIWQLSVDSNSPTIVLQLPAKYQNQVIVAPDFSKIANIRNIRWDNENSRTIFEMHVLNIDGTEDTIYPIENMDFLTWAPDSEHFVLVSTGLWQYYLGKVGYEPIPLTEQNSREFSWVDETHFLYVLSDREVCEIRLGTIGEPSILLADLKKFIESCSIFYDFTK